jgi:26S proteasome regulatory subunit N2
VVSFSQEEFLIVKRGLYCDFWVQVIQHGACLGLGLAALGTADEEIYDDIKNVLYTDSAVAGEAAGISMGLLMVGTASEKASEMLAYAHETQHEKIIR